MQKKIETQELSMKERERERLSKNESNMSGFLQLLDFIVYILI